MARLELDADMIHDLRRACGCDRRQAGVLGTVVMAPLISSPQVVELSGEPGRYVTDTLNDFVDHGIIRYHELGCTADMERRYWLTPEGRTGLPPRLTAWHRDEGIANLLQRLQLVECGYRAVAAQTGLGPLQEFSWSVDTPWDGVAQYEAGWILLLWAGVLAREADIRRKFHRLGEALENQRDRHYDPSGAFPHRLVFLVSDAWQREMVDTVTRELRIEDCVQTISIRDGLVVGAATPGPGYGRIFANQPYGGLGGWPLDARLDASRWSSPGGALASALMNCAVEWPGTTTELAKAYIVGTQSDRSIRRGLADLEKLDLLEKHQFDGRTNAYAIGQTGYSMMAVRDSVRGGRVPGRYLYNAGAYTPRVRRHETGLRRFAQECYDQGLLIAAGHRLMWDPAAPTIVPDAIVWLDPGHGLPVGWCYLEYELSGRGPRRIERKLLRYPGYDTPGWRPLLAVAPTDRAEEVWQAQSLELGRVVLTTTVARFEEHGFPGGWSFYGTTMPLA